MDNKCHELAEIVMGEKLKEKFNVNVSDELIGLNIYAAQTKFAEYRQKFELLIDDKSEYALNLQITDQLGETLMKFNTDEYKNDRLMLSSKIIKKMREKEIPYSGELFHNIVYVYTES